MNTTEMKAAVAEVLSVMHNNVEDLKVAIERDVPGGYVFVWPEYWLGALVEGTKVRAVGVNHATVTHRAADQRVFTNGKGEQAVVMPRIEALKGALAHAVAVETDFAARVAKQTEA